jgi:hypothetical protein
MKKIQLIERVIGAAGDSIRISEELDRNYSSLNGISVLDNLGFAHSFESISVEGKEILPKGFEVLFLQSSSNVAPSERFFPLNEKAAGGKIEIDFQDGGDAPAYPYTLKIYLALS